MAWTHATTLTALESGPVVFKRSPKQIAIFRAGHEVRAIDNRCPHEGYPLAEGSVDSSGCVLTCNWHNWKFQLADGKCVIGGDNVRTYPVKIDEDGSVQVELADPPPDEIEASIMGGLRVAYDKRDFGRICREITRLHSNGLDAVGAVRRAVDWSHDRLEFGTTHAFAAAADWMAMANRHADDWESRLICLAETVDHMAFDSLRHPQYPFADDGTAFDRNRFLAAIESEHRESAESMIASALRNGTGWDDLEDCFTHAALAHFNDFGHSAIYVYKTRQLIEALGDTCIKPLALALARHLIYTTREDLIPEFSGYQSALNELQSLTSGSNLEAPELEFPCSIQRALDWVVEQFPIATPSAVFDKMLRVLAQNMLYYDMSFDSAWDRPVSQSVGWLSFTHGLTFANACRILCERHPKLWPASLLQMGCFIGRNRNCVDAEQDIAHWHVEDPRAFFDSARDRILDHGQRDPIFSAHLLKTTLAIEEELPIASATTGGLMLAGLNRFLNSPIKQKHVRRLAHQAIQLVQRDFNASHSPHDG